jgi:ABC-type lipoprotein release transport system permease subunit
VARRLDPRIEIRWEPLTARFDRYLAPARTADARAAAAGLLALGLASIAMFGVFAYVVRQRTHEIGIRKALGARSPQILRLVVTASCRSALLGMALGCWHPGRWRA